MTTRRNYGYPIDYNRHAERLDRAAQDERHLNVEFPTLDEIREPWKKEIEGILERRQEAYSDYVNNHVHDRRLRRRHPQEHNHRSNNYWRTNGTEVYAENSDDGRYDHHEFAASEVSSNIGSAKSFLSDVLAKRRKKGDEDEASEGSHYYKLGAVPSIASYATSNDVIKAAKSGKLSPTPDAVKEEATKTPTKEEATPRTIPPAPRKPWFSFGRVQKKKKSAYTQVEEDDDEKAAQAYIDRYKRNLKALPKHYTADQRRRARERKKEFQDKEARKKAMEGFDKIYQDAVASDEWRYEMPRLNDSFYRRPNDPQTNNGMPKFGSRDEFANWMEQWADTFAPGMRNWTSNKSTVKVPSIEDSIGEIGKMCQESNPELISDELLNWVVHKTVFLCKGIALGGVNGDSFDSYEDRRKYGLAVKGYASRALRLDNILYSLPGHARGVQRPGTFDRVGHYMRPMTFYDLRPRGVRLAV